MASEKNDCPICLMQVKRGISTACCDNKFHKKCLGKWTQEYNSCPLCRKVVDDSKPIKKCENICIEDDEQFARELNERLNNPAPIMFQFDGNLLDLLNMNIDEIIQNMCDNCHCFPCACNINNI